MIYNYLLRIIFLNLIVFPFTILSQEVGIGQWRDHLPYSSTISVTASNNKIYCATPYCLFYFNKDDNSVNRFTSVSGLSDMGVARIGFSKQYNTLLIAYSNTNIDLVKGNTIINMSDILQSDAVTPEEKTINNLLFIDNLAYLSCGFGIVVLDVKNEEITDTYYIGPNGSHLEVFDFMYNDTCFFAATENGIYFADIDNPNLAYYESWSKDETLPFPDATYNYITHYTGKIFVNKYSSEWDNDTIMYFDNSQWHYSNETFSNSDVFGLKIFNNKFYVIHRYFIYVYDENLNKIFTIWSYYGDLGGSNPRDITVDNNILWIADNLNGLIRQNNEYDFTSIYPNGPKNADVYDMSAEGNNLWIVAGGRNPSWGDVWKHGSASSFINNEWNTYDKTNTASLDTILDLVCVAVNPYSYSNVFAGSWYKGLIEFNNGKIVNIYNEQNSSLEFVVNSSDNIIKVGGVAFDQSGNLWVTNSGANNVLSVRMPDGTSDGNWKSFYLGSSSSGEDMGQMIIDSHGQKWMLMRDHSILVFTDNGTITNDSDDQYKMLTSAVGNGNIPGNNVYSIAEDNDGEVWIGTNKGVAVFYSPENVFTNYDFDAQQILVPRNDGSGLADILLEFETVTAIAVDGANDKWIGTDRSGVFHLSPDGQKELHHFTEQNSPLFSNNIICIAINDETGEVFFGTAKGIISYKTTATGGGEENKDVYAYPNPVRPGYNGPIAIKGLVSNADFKITDISGTLIYAGRAEGGQAVWDGRNYNGRKAQSGVYMVFVTNDDGTEKLVTKILFIN